MDLRNMDTPEARQIWADVHAVAERAPEWVKVMVKQRSKVWVMKRRMLAPFRLSTDDMEWVMDSKFTVVSKPGEPDRLHVEGRVFTARH